MTDILSESEIDDIISGLQKIGDKQNFNSSSFKLNRDESRLHLTEFWLKTHGFSKELENVPPSLGRLFNLTKRGCRLKRLGSYANYVQYLQNKEDDKQLQREFIKSQAENARWQNVLNPLIRQANESTIRTNEISRQTNTYIAIFTGIAGLYYLHEIINWIADEFIDSWNPDKPNWVNFYTLISSVLTVAIILLKRVTRQQRQVL